MVLDVNLLFYWWVRSYLVILKIQSKFCPEEVEEGFFSFFLFFSPLGWGGGRELALIYLRVLFFFVVEWELIFKVTLTYLPARLTFSVWQGHSDEGLEPVWLRKPEWQSVSCLLCSLGSKWSNTGPGPVILSPPVPTLVIVFFFKKNL